jgi:hypothetical protein
MPLSTLLWFFLSPVAILALGFGLLAAGRHRRDDES